MKFELEVWIIAAAYFGYFVSAIVALVLLGMEEVSDGVIEYAQQVVFVIGAHSQRIDAPEVWRCEFEVGYLPLRGTYGVQRTNLTI